MIDRREFLRLGAGTALGLAASPALAQAGSGIRRYPVLGRTGLKVSDISFGSASMADPAIVRHALARGINYFDTAESYRWGNSEEAIGEALKGKRNDVLIASKTKAGAGDSSADMMKSLEGSLKRLQTDHVDVYFNHAVNEVNSMNPEGARCRASADVNPKGLRRLLLTTKTRRSRRNTKKSKNSKVLSSLWVHSR